MTDTATRTAVEITHRRPTTDLGSVTPCCLTDPDTLPPTARLTDSPLLANCPGPLYVVVVGPSVRCSVYGPTTPERAVEHRDDVARDMEAAGMTGTPVLMRAVAL